MAVVVRPKFNMQQIRKYMQGRRQQIKDAILNGLMVIGETFVANARNTDTYHDVTGNLRSSIGYVIYYNGRQQNISFPGGAGEGVSEGQQLAHDVAENYPEGYVIVCVAGMNYAASVESRGFDVITNSSIEAKQDIERMIERLKTKINRL